MKEILDEEIKEKNKLELYKLYEWFGFIFIVIGAIFSRVEYYGLSLVIIGVIYTCSSTILREIKNLKR